MKRMLATALIVLMASLGVMTAGLLYLNRAVTRATALGSEAVLAAQMNRGDSAAETMVALAEFWHGHAPTLEMLAGHDALHEVQVGIAEAQICLECEDRDDFLRCMAVAGEALRHLRDEQALRLSNLY